MRRIFGRAIIYSSVVFSVYSHADTPTFRYEPIGQADSQYSTYGRALSESGLVGFLQVDNVNRQDTVGIYENTNSQRLLLENSTTSGDIYVVRDDWTAGGEIGTSATKWDSSGPPSAIYGSRLLDFDSEGRAITMRALISGGLHHYPVIVNSDGTYRNMVDPVVDQDFVFQDINDNGIAVIRCEYGLYTKRVCYWSESSGLVDLGLIFNQMTWPYAINNSNQIVGVDYSYNKGFIYDVNSSTKTMIDLQGTVAKDISDDGYIVGKYLLSGVKYGFLYVDGVVYNLNNITIGLPENHDSVNIVEAVKINNKHDIVVDVEVCDDGSCYIQAARLTKFVPVEIDLALSATNSGDIREGQYGYVNFAVSNLATDPATDVTVNIDSSNIYGITSVAGACNHGATTATCTFNSVPGGQTESISLTVLPGLGQHSTNATVSTSDIDTNAANDAASTVLNVNHAVDLQVITSKKGKWTNVTFTWGGATGSVSIYKDNTVVFTGGTSGTYASRYDRVHNWKACLTSNPNLCSMVLTLNTL